MGVRFQVEPTEKVIPTKFKVTQPVSTARIGFENVQVVTDLGPSVLYVPQELTEEQKAQARENIDAIDKDYLCYKQPPIYRIDASNPVILNIYINIRDLDNGGYYYFNVDKQIPENTATAWQLIYIVVCDDGTEFQVYSRGGLNGFQLGQLIQVNNFFDIDWTKGSCSIVLIDENMKYMAQGTPDTSINLTKKTFTNAKYLSTITNYEYTPTSDYNPATKKYVDDSVIAVASKQIQPDWLQTDKAAADFIKNKPDIATDDEILEMLVELDMLPAVANSDGALLSDENGNILLW